MTSDDLSDSIRRKRFVIDCFLTTASLSPDGNRDVTLRLGVTSHYLQAVVLELLIKIFYELDVRSSAPSTHRLADIFSNLDGWTQRFLKREYGAARRRRIARVKARADIEFAAWADVLSHNENVVRDFKYDAVGSPINSAADGDFYSAVLTRIDSRLGGRDSN